MKNKNVSKRNPIWSVYILLLILMSASTVSFATDVVSVEVPVSKTIEGAGQKTEFLFLLEGDFYSSSLRLKGTGQGMLKIDLPKEPGVYSFILREEAGRGSYGYDDSIYNVYVLVTNDNQVITSIEKDGLKYESAEFSGHDQAVNAGISTGDTSTVASYMAVLTAAISIMALMSFIYGRKRSGKGGYHGE